MHESFSERDACFYCGSALSGIDLETRSIGCVECFDIFANEKRLKKRVLVGHFDASIDTTQPAYVSVPMTVMPFIQRAANEPEERGLLFFARRLKGEQSVRIYASEWEEWTCDA